MLQSLSMKDYPDEIFKVLILEIYMGVHHLEQVLVEHF